jgi:hypothetical protein
MKLIVLHAQNAPEAGLIHDETLSNLQGLLITATFGTIRPDDSDNLLSLIEAQVGTIEGGLNDLVKDSFTLGSSSQLEGFDAALGEILQGLNETAVILIVVQPQSTTIPTSFILASTESPLEDCQQALRVRDLAATTLTLAGFPIPADSVALPLQGALGDGMLEEDEELVRERLRGLGYIA